MKEQQTYKKRSTVKNIFIGCSLFFFFLPSLWEGAGMGLFSQDAFFSQYNSAPLLLNPAHTGNMDGKMRACANYKNQWKSFGAEAKVSALSVDFSLFSDSAKKEKLGIGIFFFNDKIGTMAYSTTDFGISIAFHTKNIEKKQYFSAGLQGGAFQKSVDINNLSWSSQFVGDHYDNTLLSGEIFYSDKVLRENFSVGALWQYLPSEKFNAHCGMSIYHVNRPDVSFMKNNVDKLESRFSLHAGMDVALSGDNFFLSPKFLYMKQGYSRQYTIGLSAKKMLGKNSQQNSSFSAGVFYRFSAIAPVVQLEFNGMKLGISYDVNAGDFQSAFGNKGGMEISLTYVPSRKTNSNPSFHK